jgi:hypothetical protein
VKWKQNDVSYQLFLTLSQISGEPTTNSKDTKQSREPATAETPTTAVDQQEGTKTAGTPTIAGCQ